MNKYIAYRQYEIAPELVSNTKIARFNLLVFIGKTMSKIVQRFTRSYEPQIWQEQDKAGNIWWCAYNPYTQQSIYCSTEEEIFAWLDQQPY